MRHVGEEVFENLVYRSVASFVLRYVVLYWVVVVVMVVIVVVVVMGYDICIHMYIRGSRGSNLDSVNT